MTGHLVAVGVGTERGRPDGVGTIVGEPQVVAHLVPDQPGRHLAPQVDGVGPGMLAFAVRRHQVSEPCEAAGIDTFGDEHDEVGLQLVAPGGHVVHDPVGRRCHAAKLRRIATLLRHGGRHHASQAEPGRHEASRQRRVDLLDRQLRERRGADAPPAPVWAAVVYATSTSTVDGSFSGCRTEPAATGSRSSCRPRRPAAALVHGGFTVGLICCRSSAAPSRRSTERRAVEGEVRDERVLDARTGEAAVGGVLDDARVGRAVEARASVVERHRDDAPVKSSISRCAARSAALVVPGAGSAARSMAIGCERMTRGRPPSGATGAIAWLVARRKRGCAAASVARTWTPRSSRGVEAWGSHYRCCSQRQSFPHLGDDQPLRALTGRCAQNRRAEITR